ISRVAAHVLAAVMVLSPAFVLYENWLMYTFPAAAMLGASVFLLMRYVESGSTRWGVVFFATIALLALTRSLFHLAWALVIAGGLALYMRQGAKQVLLCAAVPLLVVAGWYGKNHYLFGTFSSSTWLGLGLSNITTLMVPETELEPLVDEGVLSPYALVSRYEATERLFSGPDREGAHIPVLDNRRKSTGEYNYNYAGLIEINRKYTADAIETARRFPERYLEGVALANRLFFSPSSMNYYFLTENRVAAAPMEMVYNPIVFGAKVLPTAVEQPHFGHSGKYTVETNAGVLLVIGVPLLFLYAAGRTVYGLVRRGAVRPVETVVTAFIAFNMLYIYLLGTLLELSENYRYRFLMEPLLVMLVGLLIVDVWRARNRAKKT
ncbi:MAG: hypothetical protein MI725_13220, partial [Pirellulales bacterium]|nr:hypothetical protein [Pirellulales bacterium]